MLSHSNFLPAGSVTAFALLLAGCSDERRPLRSEVSPPVENAGEFAAKTSELAAPSSLSEVEAEPARAVFDATVEPRSVEPRSAVLLEKSFRTSADPRERITLVNEIGALEPGVAVAIFARHFPDERREDVKMEILSALNDLDHSQAPDAQLTLCLQALAPTQPASVRQVALQVLSDLGDPRARFHIAALQRDRDPEMRRSATETMRDLDAL